MPQPVSFIRLAAPVLIAWAATCLAFAHASGYADSGLASVVYLFPVYAGLYLVRTNVLLLQGSVAAKAAAAFLLFLMWVPAAYVLPQLIFALGIGLFYAIIYPWGFVISAFEGLPGSDALFLLPILVIGGGICGAALSLLERIVIGTTATRPHIVGLMAAGVPAAALPIRDPDTVPESVVAMILLAILPLPHLFAVWRDWRRRGGLESSSFAPRRALVFAGSVYAVVYAVGIVRFWPDHSIAGLVWPRIVYQEEHRLAVDRERHIVLGAPQGRGAQPIGGRSYVIPAAFTEGRRQAWNDAPGEYASMSMRVPYAEWIGGFDAGDLDPIGDRERLENADLLFSALLPSSESGVTVRCAPVRHYGLRQCFADGDDDAWLADWGIDLAELERVHLDGWHGSAGRYDVLVLDDRRQATAAWNGEAPAATIIAAGGDTGFLARCSIWAVEETDGRAPPLPEWQHSDCTVQFPVGDAWVRMTMNVQLLRFWREIRAGLRADIADWQAAAEDAEPIDAVALRLAQERAEVPLPHYIGRLFSAVLE